MAFWNKKKPTADTTFSGDARVLGLYLAAALPPVSNQLGSDAARGAAQVHVLGMVDMLRQVHKWSLEAFVTTYRTALAAAEISPKSDLQHFVSTIAHDAKAHPEIEKVMRVAAQSIQMFVAEKDAEAPLDLAQATLFGTKHAAIFGPVGKR